jgi:hypothetical protein
MTEGQNLETQEIGISDKSKTPLLTEASFFNNPEISPDDYTRHVYETLLNQARSKLGKESGVVTDTDFWATLIKENKLTNEGRELAQDLYAAINFGSPDEVRTRAAGLKKIRDDIKINMDITKENIRWMKREVTEGKRMLKDILVGKRERKTQTITLGEQEYYLSSEEEELFSNEEDVKNYKRELATLKLESLFLHRVVSSIDMQIGHNEVTAVREELYTDQFSNSSWGRVVRRAISSDPDRVDLNQKENKFYVNSAARIINSLRMGVISNIMTHVEEDPNHPLYGKSEGEIMDFLRVAEKRMIEIKLAQIDKGEIVCKEFGDFFRAMYGKEPGKGEYSPIPRQMKTLQVGISDEGVKRTTILEEIINDSMKRAMELKEVLPEVNQIEAILRPEPTRWEKVVGDFKKAVHSGVAVATSVASLLGIIRGLSETASAQALEVSSDNIYQEYSRQESLSIPVATAEFSFELPKTEMQTLGEVATKKCLSPIKTKAGTAWVYNEKAKDDVVCESKFPGIKFVGTNEYENVLPVGLLDIPQQYKDAVLVKNFYMNREQGATCSLTSITSIVNWVRAREGLPMLHSAVFSDMAQKANGSVEGAFGERESPKLAAPTRTLGEYSDLNLFYIDPIGLGENFGVIGKSVSIRDIYGGSTDIEVRKDYVRNHPKEVANNLLSHFLDQIKNGNFPTVASLVSREFGHVVMVIGGGVDKDNVPYFLVAEPNGGYTGWEYTSGHWEKVGKNGLVKIRLDAYNLASLAPYDEHMSFYKYDPDKEKEFKVKWIKPEIKMPFSDIDFTKPTSIAATFSVN